MDSRASFTTSALPGRREQREVVTRLHDGRKGTDIAQKLGITKQAVSRYASLAGWEAYSEAEQGWSALLRTLVANERP